MFLNVIESTESPKNKEQFKDKINRLKEKINAIRKRIHRPTIKEIGTKIKQILSDLKPPKIETIK